MIHALAISVAIWPLALFSQGTTRSPEQLVRLLTEDKLVCRTTNFTNPTEKRQAFELVSKGNAALAPMEAPLAQLEAGRQYNLTCGIEWFLYAFARLQGPTAYPRLMRMHSNQRLRYLHRELEVAAAVSLDLTSVLSNFDRPSDLDRWRQMGPFPDHVLPQQAMDKFLAGLLGDDRKATDESLSTAARAILEDLATARAWEALRAGLRSAGSDAPIVIAYRLSLPAGMSGPLRPDFGFDLVEPHERQVSGTVEFFKEGSACGHHVLHFRDQAWQSGRNERVAWRFALENTDLDVLIGTIAGCASGIRANRPATKR